MKIAHRKNVLFRDHAWWDSVVNLASGGGGFAHSELIFTNGESFTSTTQFERATLVYPHRAFADPRKNGPLIRRIEFPDWEWAFTELNVTDSEELQVYEWCRQTIDDSIKARAGYDWMGVARFVFKFLKEHPADWFCSESDVAALQTIGYFKDEKAWTVSPNKLWKLCQQIKPH